MKKLLIRNISLPMIGFLAFFTVTFVFYFLYLLGLDTPEKYVPIITATVALYTPFGAWKLAEKWKEQKKFDIKQKIILELCLEVNKIENDALTLKNRIRKIRQVRSDQTYNSYAIHNELKIFENFQFTTSAVYGSLDIYTAIFPKNINLIKIFNEINSLVQDVNEAVGIFSSLYRNYENTKELLSESKWNINFEIELNQYLSVGLPMDCEITKKTIYITFENMLKKLCEKNIFLKSELIKQSNLLELSKE